ncbi:MAG: protein-disulfide reductase DsbD family protein, partial [Bacteroidota bacterium]|nr:protein-disulfide reductase DsbD family protein [Bacteroidota bacterium]
MKKGFTLILLLMILSHFASAQVLDPVKWKFNQKKTGPQEYELTFTASIDNGWHLYSTDLPDGGPVKTSFKFEKSSKYTFTSAIAANVKPSESYDPNFQMKLRFFKNKVTFVRKIKLLEPGEIQIKGVIEYMSCNDETCTPPAEAEFDFKLKSDLQSGTLTAATKNSGANAATGDSASKKVTADTTTKSLSTPDTVKFTSAANVKSENPSSGNSGSVLWKFFILAFLGGLAALLTPCVFPMIPMTVSFFIHTGKTKAQAILHALIYGISIIAIYTVIGTIVAVSFGPDAANFLSTHWLPNILFFLVFMIFAFSFFGMFEIVLPSWVVNKADKQSDKGGFIGAFFMALTLVLV